MSEHRRVVRGVELAYSLTGPESGPAVVQLHGLGSSRRREDDSDSHPTSAASGLRVLRIDAPGHGLSGPGMSADDYTWRGYARLLAEVVGEVFGPTPVHGVGVSMGAGTLLHAAVEKLFPLASLTLLIPPTAWAERRARRAGYEASADFIESQGFAAFVNLAGEVPPPPATDAGQPIQVADLRPDSAADVYRGAGSSDLPEPEKLAGVELPAQVMAWSGDPSHPLSIARELQVRLGAAPVQVAHTPGEVALWPRRVAGFIHSLA